MRDLAEAVGGPTRPLGKAVSPTHSGPKAVSPYPAPAEATDGPEVAVGGILAWPGQPVVSVAFWVGLVAALYLPEVIARPDTVVVEAMIVPSLLAALMARLLFEGFIGTEPPPRPRVVTRAAAAAAPAAAAVGATALILGLAGVWVGTPVAAVATAAVLSLALAARSLELQASAGGGRGRKGSRAVLRAAGEVARRARIAPEPDLVVGAGPLAKAVELKLELERRHYLQWDQPLRGGRGSECPQLEAALTEQPIGQVVLADPDLDRETIEGLVRVCRASGVSLSVAAPNWSHHDAEIDWQTNGALPGSRRAAAHSWRSAPSLIAKRVTDVVGAALLLVLLSPVMLAVGLATVMICGRPIIFRQTRVGNGGRPFEIFKLRTLDPTAQQRADKTIAALSAGRITIEEAVKLLKDSRAPAVSRLGRWLRRTSLDEVPQLWNVLRGEMSLVGPRPLRPFEVETLDRWQNERHQVPPGLSGLWQVSGRSNIDWNVRMWLDHLYVREWSFFLDLKILARTPLAVARKEGAH